MPLGPAHHSYWWGTWGPAGKIRCWESISATPDLDFQP